MNLYELYLEKLAARYQLPAAGKKIMWESGANMGKAVLGQAGARTAIKNQFASVGTQGPGTKANILKGNKSMASEFGSQAGGTIVDKSAIAKNAVMPKGKDRVALINRDMFGKKARNAETEARLKEVGDNYTDFGKQQLIDKYTKQQKQLRRQVIAHEAFHANAPKRLRSSETLAHAYGGWKGTKGNVFQKAQQALAHVKHYGRSRPERIGAQVINAVRSPVKTMGAAIGGAAQTIKKSFTKSNPMKNWGAKPAGLTGAITKITKV